MLVRYGLAGLVVLAFYMPPGHIFIVVPAELYENAKCMRQGLALHARIQADNGVWPHGLRKTALLARARVGPDVTTAHLRAHVRVGMAKHRVPPVQAPFVGAWAEAVAAGIQLLAVCTSRVLNDPLPHRSTGLVDVAALVESFQLLVNINLSAQSLCLVLPVGICAGSDLQKVSEYIYHLAFFQRGG